MRRLKQLMMKEEGKVDKSKKNKKKSRNTRSTECPNKEMFGYKILNTVTEALEFDKINENDLWKRGNRQGNEGPFLI